MGKSTSNPSIAVAGSTPQANGSTVNSPGSGGGAPQVADGGNAVAAPGVAPQGSTPSSVPAPPGVIQPQEFYTLDSNNPERRFTGVQLKEAIIRAGQYDNMQGEFQRQQRDLAQEREGRENAERQLQEIQEKERLGNYMQQYGFGQPAQPGSNTGQPPNQSQTSQPPQPGQQPDGQAGAEAGEDWLANFGSQSSGQPEGTAGQPGQGAISQPGSPGATPQTNSPQSPLNDPRQMAVMMKAIIDDSLSKTVTPQLQNLPQLVDAAVNQRFTQQAQQANVRDSFQAGRQQLSTDLNQKWGIDPARSRDILDKWTLSSTSYEEASKLMQGTYSDDTQRAQATQLADEKIAQGNMFFNAALQDAMQAAHEGQSVRFQQEAQQQLLSGNYAQLGDLAEPNRNVWDPNQVDQVNSANLTKAMEIAETQGRLQAVAGPIGPAIQPSGFIQPGMVQPGQPTGYVPATQPNQPMPGPQAGPAPIPQPRPQGVQSGAPAPGWGAFQHEGYGQAA